MSTLTRDALLQRNADDKERLQHRMEKNARDRQRLRIEAAAHASAAAKALLHPTVPLNHRPIPRFSPTTSRQTATPTQAIVAPACPRPAFPFPCSREPARGLPSILGQPPQPIRPLPRRR